MRGLPYAASLLFSFLVALSGGELLGQASLQSKLNVPYSRFALGQMSGRGVVRNESMGGTGYAHAHVWYPNLVNPALLPRTKYTAFDVSYQVEHHNLRTENAEQTTTDGRLTGFLLALPLSPRWSMALGLRPYSQVTYRYTIDQPVGTDGTFSRNDYEGSGGINQFFLSSGLKITERWMVGLEAGFLLGEREDESISQLFLGGTSPNITKIAYNSSTSYSGFIFRPGMAFRKELRFSTKPVSGSLRRPNPDYLPYDELIAVCMETQPDSLPERERRRRCQEQVKPEDKFIDYADTTYNKRVLLDGGIYERWADSLILGEYALLIRGHSGITVSDQLRPEEIDRLARIAKDYESVDYGIVIRSQAKDVQPRAIQEDLRTLRDVYFGKRTAVVPKKEWSEGQRRRMVRDHVRDRSGLFFNFGLTGQLNTPINGEITETVQRRDLAGGVLSADTLARDIKPQTLLPWEIGVGIAIDRPQPRGVRRNGKQRTAAWSLGLDLTYTAWSTFDDASAGTTTGLDDGYRVALGGEIQPNIMVRPETFAAKLGHWAYRGGLSYQRMPYQLGGQPIDAFGINLGLGIPVGPIDQALNLPRLLNVGFEGGWMGDDQDGRIRDGYWRLSVGFTLNARWFQKRERGL